MKQTILLTILALLSLNTMAESHATANLLDSIVSINADGSYRNKYEYAYDANGNKTLDASYRWNTTTGRWEGSDYHRKDEYTYDDNGKQIQSISYSWDSER